MLPSIQPALCSTMSQCPALAAPKQLYHYLKCIEMISQRLGLTVIIPAVLPESFYPSVE